MLTTLDRLRKSQCGLIAGVSRQGCVAQRLMAIGLMPGRAIRLTRIAPLGDPISVDVGGMEISLRRAEAALLTIDLSPTDNSEGSAT